MVKSSSWICVMLGTILAMSLTHAAIAQQAVTVSPTTMLSRRHAAYEIVTTIERLAARIVYVEGVGLLSQHEDWPEETERWPEATSVTKFIYDVHNLSRRVTPELAGLRRSSARPGIFNEEEMARVNAILDDLELMIEGSDELYALLAAGQTREANDHFRTNVRAPYDSAIAGSYTVGVSISADISRISLAARMEELR